jgi:hypothetical protein
VKRRSIISVVALAAVCFLWTGWSQGAYAQDSAEELAKKLANPVASLISAPFQLNYDGDIGILDEGERWTLNVQPVVPFSLNDDWNLISRTIVPLVHQTDIFPDADSQTGVGDIVQSLFFSPATLGERGWIWGTGPVLLLPTGSDDLLTADKLGLGPTAVVLRQQGPWTYGGLVNHIWSVAGDEDRGDINATFLQPFVSYTTKGAVSITAQTESTYDWESEEASAPIMVVATKVAKLGGQMISLGGGVRYYADSSSGGPEGWGGRALVVLLFPK